MENFLRIIQDLIDRIENGLEYEANIVALASSYGISAFHFQRLFKALVGDSLGRYIRGRRLTRAAEMLLETDSGVLDIGLAVGFNSHEAFSRSFKSYFDKTPKDFRYEKPQVVLSRKPILSMELFEHLKMGMQREPQIVYSESQIIVGPKKRVSSPFLSEGRYCADTDLTWAELAKRKDEIKNTIPRTFFGLTVSDSGDFTEEWVDYIAGVSVTHLEAMPEGMFHYLLPAGQVAQFEMYDTSEDRYKETVDYIYGYWLPNSNYVRGNGVDYVLVENMSEIGAAGFSLKYVMPVDVGN